MTYSALTHPTLGGFTFIRMTPPPPEPTAKGFFEARVGVNGYGVWREAIRGQMWDVETFVDTFSVTAGILLKLQYEQAPFNGIWYANWENIRTVPVVVKGVMVDVKPTLGAVGGTLGPLGHAIVTARWSMMTG